MARTPLAVQLANLLAELAKRRAIWFYPVKFQCGGAEVVEALIKLEARQYHRLTGSPRKYKVISRYQSWHGSTLGALSASGLKSRKTVNEPMAPGFVHVFPPTCYRCPFGKSYPDCGVTCATIVGDVIEMEDPATVAAVLVEPIGHTGGVIDPPEEYLPILREICDKHNILLIFDEIITGIGRTGRMFAAETFGVTPDVLLVAKGLSGGYAPLSAMICRGPIGDTFWGPISENPGFVEGHTFEGNPISCAAGLAVLREIPRAATCWPTPGSKAVASASGSRIWRASIRSSVTSAARACSRRSSSSATGRRRRVSPRTRRPSASGSCRSGRLQQHGLLCRFDPHWIAFGPPLIVTAEQVDEMTAILDRSIGEVLGELGTGRAGVGEG